MRQYPLLPAVQKIFSGPRGSNEPIWVQPVARIMGIAFLTLGVTSGVSALFGSVTPDRLIPSLALIIFGALILRGPKPPEKVWPLNILAALAFIPLAPFYVNFGGEKLWGEDWWNIAPPFRAILLGIAATIALVLTTVYLLLRRNEVRDYRREGLYSAIRNIIPDRDDSGLPLTYQERDTRIKDLEGQWGSVPLPVDRCRLLIAAGIPAQEATTAQTKELTDEHLKTMAYLANEGKRLNSPQYFPFQ